MWTKEQLANLARKKGVLVGVASVASAGAGATLGYLEADKRAKAKYEQLAEEEIAEAKRFYAKLHKEGDFAQPETALEKYMAQVQDYTSEAEVTVTDGSETGVAVAETVEETDDGVEIQERAVNIFASSEPVVEDDFDYDAELESRTKDEPYVIANEEFYENEPEYEQNTLTYFEGDDVLVDDKDQPIEDTDRTVGNANLLRFGHGSKDQNVVYIRNDRMQMDFEVLRSRGDYVKEVLGFIEHSDRPGRGKIRKFRSDDG